MKKIGKLFENLMNSQKRVRFRKLSRGGKSIFCRDENDVNNSKNFPPNVTDSRLFSQICECPCSLYKTRI